MSGPESPGAAAVVAELKALGSEENRAGMARFGIDTSRAFGIPMAELRPIARRLGRDHDLARALWESGIHEARLLAVLVDEPKLVTRDQMNAWAAASASWDLTDQACMKLFVKTAHVEKAIAAWAGDEREFVRRAAFALMAAAAVHVKRRPDADFLPWLGLVEQYAGDGRNYVKKAVNWALRQIGKRSMALHAPALDLARRLADSDDRTRRWIGRDAAKELTRPEQIARIEARTAKST